MKRMMSVRLVMIAMMIFSVGIVFANTTDPLKGMVISSISVKDANAERVSVMLQVQNATNAEMNLFIRNEAGDVIHEERLQLGSFEKIFHLGIEESQRFRFDIRQGKNLVKSKEVRVQDKMEKVIEVQGFAGPNLANRR